MEKIFEKIWEKALPYQDKRYDEGHARIVTDFAKKLCEIEKVEREVVVPAAILHDIGWSQLSEKERFSIFDKNLSEDDELRIRFKHQDEGVRLARRILEEVEYPKVFVGQILEIISQHDTREGFFSREDSLMRDADKLWRYSKEGIKADIGRFGISKEELLEKYKSNIGKPGFFYSDLAKRLAKEELEKYQ